MECHVGRREGGACGSLNLKFTLNPIQTAFQEYQQECKEDAELAAEEVLALYRKRAPFQLVIEPRLTAYRDFFQRHAPKIQQEDESIKDAEGKLNVGRLSYLVSKQFHLLSPAAKSVWENHVES